MRDLQGGQPKFRTKYYHKSRTLFLFFQMTIRPLVNTLPTMISYLFLAFSSYLVYTLVNRVISLRRNIALANAWGLPYVVLRE
jgi:hypothetical protein